VENVGFSKANYTVLSSLKRFALFMGNGEKKGRKVEELKS
jgi:hypothetical protein